jgi:hypothetical protein
VSAINRIVIEMGWQVHRIAVDAPAAPPATGPRASEDELGRSGLSSFRTPVASKWPSIRQQGADHLGLGGDLASLPHANKIWMPFGFELFACLKNGLRAEVIEVYPLLPACEHKSTENGYRDQLAAVAARTGWEPQKLEARLKEAVAGSRHDRLDAFMAAWVARLPPQGRRALRPPAG